MSYEVHMPPNIKDFQIEEVSFVDTMLDGEALSKVNKALIQNIVSLRTVNKLLSTYERQRAAKEIEHKHNFRAFMAKDMPGRTEAQKKLLAEISCETTEGELIYLSQMSEELKRRSFAIKAEQEALKMIGWNIRQELNV